MTSLQPARFSVDQTSGVPHLRIECNGHHFTYAPPIPTKITCSMCGAAHMIPSTFAQQFNGAVFGAIARGPLYQATEITIVTIAEDGQEIHTVVPLEGE